MLRRASISMMTSAKEVGPALFFSLLVITVSFMPIFTLEAQEGRLFKPLAFTKTFAMASASALSVTLVPVPDACCSSAGTYHAGARQPGEPCADLALPPRHQRCALKAKPSRLLARPCGIGGSLLACQPSLGSEFMPNLNEGTLAVHADDAAGPLGHQGG
jgi:Cu(I)/Ag(I) efflux system membrane protein CusA/SilA